MARYFKLAITGLALLAGTAAFGAAGPSAKGVLASLDPGDWDLRFRNDDAARQNVCFDGGRQLIQIRHANLNCQSVVLSDSPEQVTVHYTCPGQGYGRTSIRRETSRLVQIESQGIAKGVPFAFTAEGRRVGACKP